MKRLLISASILFITANLAKAQDKEQEPFEIVKYYFVELITNPDRAELPKVQVDSIQAAHMANMGVMAERGELMLAGPFEGGGGIFVLNVPTMEAAEKLVAKDPAVSAGRLKTKIRAWYTTKGSFGIEAKQNKDNQPKE